MAHHFAVWQHAAQPLGWNPVEVWVEFALFTVATIAVLTLSCDENSESELRTVASCGASGYEHMRAAASHLVLFVLLLVVEVLLGWVAAAVLDSA